MIPYEEARAFVLAGCTPLEPRPVPLGDAAGTVLAEEIVAAEDVPPFANTAMDGFAVRAADTAGATDADPVRLEIAGTLLAGAAPTLTVGVGQAMRIMTGAPMPPGADAVVMVERTSVPPVGRDEPAVVEVRVAVEPGNHVRPAGDDVREGDVLFSPGERLTPGHVGVLATVGVTGPRVVPRPVVGVLSTGDELVDGGGPLGPGQIRDSNRVALLALLAERGCTGVDLGRAPDDDGAIAAAIERGVATCDAVITSGGVSMGDVDLVKVVLDRLGDMRWMQVAIKPAKPLAFGTVARPGDGRRIPVFGLPGNPVSSLVSFELFAGPGLRRLAGFADDRLDRARVRAVADVALDRRPDGKVHFPRVTVRRDPDTGRYHVRPAGGQGSHHLTAMARADALAVLPDGAGVPAGATVELLLLRDESSVGEASVAGHP